MMLAEQPALRKNDGMMRSYMFLVDFLEVVSQEAGAQTREWQGLLR
jgi:hypothetical protein